MAIAQSSLFIGGVEIPVVSLNTLVVGTGAAGLSCVLRLLRALEEAGSPDDALDEVALATRGIGLGVSNNSGSDKQTYYTMGARGAAPDSPEEFAKTLTRAGCMHGDMAWIEGENSVRALHYLADLGVPFPHTAQGAFIGYKTDHDPRQRGTSAGPWTSRFMVQKLLAEVQRRRIRIFNNLSLLALILEGEAGERKVCGALCADLARQTDANHGLTLFNCRNAVVAAGGPGELYEYSVYPRGQMAPYAALLEAGAEAVNLSESQFGMTSLAPRWCLSGTYQQVVPRYYSLNRHGEDEQNFLAPWFESAAAMGSATFFKGYQWPFDCDRIAGGGSSLIDLLVFREVAMNGRRVFVDYTRNPSGVDPHTALRLDQIHEQAFTYLKNSGALQDRPIDRLAQMNPPSIDLYLQQGVDLRKEPVELAVCAQHCNGGFAVDPWWESNIRHLFVLGEFAGTHGVKRPGGSSLNSGQVGALRAAQRIAHVYYEHATSAEEFGRLAAPTVEAAVKRIARIKSGASSAADCAAVKHEIQSRMSRYAGPVRSAAGLSKALAEAQAEYRRLQESGVKQDRPGFLKAWDVEDMALAQLAFLHAIRDLLERGSGSRGSHMVVGASGRALHPRLEEEFHALGENEALREEILVVSYDRDAGAFRSRAIPARPIPQVDLGWFENVWADFRRGAVFEKTPEDRPRAHTIYALKNRRRDAPGDSETPDS